MAKKYWNDWRWQVRHSLRTIADLERHLLLSEDERAALRRTAGRLPVSITPYYLQLLDPYNPFHPLRRLAVPTLCEFQRTRGERRDPLGEDRHMVVPGLVHTYPDKVLLLASNVCPVYCRYCTRARRVGQRDGRANWPAAIEYIRRHKGIRDVLISGGEPLMLTDERLDDLLRELRRIPHIEIIRISSRAPAVLPQRITSKLVRVLRKYHPLWMSLHFAHPDELTPEAKHACARLADAGIPLCSQTVLLRGINDDEETMRRLMTGLLTFRVKPYYLHQCDAIRGRGHFRTSVQRGIELIRSLHGHTTGYAVPWFMVDAPGGGGKVPLAPNYVLGRTKGQWILRNYANRIYRYFDGAATDH